MVPVGELPRHVLLSADRFVHCYISRIFADPSTRRYLTGKVVPGTRVIATGIYSTFQNAKSGVRLVHRSFDNF